MDELRQRNQGHIVLATQTDKRAPPLISIRLEGTPAPLNSSYAASYSARVP
jgi:hypothetical protein